VEASSIFSLLVENSELVGAGTYLCRPARTRARMEG
jgi:hypothetical protein